MVAKGGPRFRDNLLAASLITSCPDCRASVQELELGHHNEKTFIFAIGQVIKVPYFRVPEQQPRLNVLLKSGVLLQVQRELELKKQSSSAVDGGNVAPLLVIRALPGMCGGARCPPSSVASSKNWYLPMWADLTDFGITVRSFKLPRPPPVRAGRGHSPECCGN